MVLIHIGEQSYPGSFSVDDNYATIRYEGKEIVVDKRSCKFTKHVNMHDRTVYYNAYYDEGSNKTMGKTMDEKSMDEKEYGTKKDQDKTVHIGKSRDDAGIIDRLTGKASAIFSKNQAEEKLNEMWKEFDNTIGKIDAQEQALKELDAGIPALEKISNVVEKEWSESLTSLGNLINKKTTHEKMMWGTTQATRQNRGMKIKQKFIRAGVDEMNFNSMQDYIKQYPELQSSDIIQRAVDKVDQKRTEKVDAETKLATAIAKFNLGLNTFEGLTEKAESNLEEFSNYIPEAEQKVNNSKYNKSGVVGKLRTLETEYEHQATRLNMLPYKGILSDRKIVLKRVKDELSDYKRKHWVEKEQK
ncbi:MAG: hypothetical protein KGH62_02010 [Candidatus Micrarchaeota archaeon]|nr:hypothetical protein [Candidatus Micrarchaeota archaeon]